MHYVGFWIPAPPQQFCVKLDRTYCECQHINGETRGAHFISQRDKYYPKTYGPSQWWHPLIWFVFSVSFH